MHSTPEALRATRGARIRQARVDKGLSQEALASAMEPPVTKAAVSDWESGKSSPRLPHQFALIRVLDADLAAVFGIDLDGAA